MVKILFKIYFLSFQGFFFSSLNMTSVFLLSANKLGDGNPLHYSCLENPMNRGAWQATVRGVTKSQTRQRLTHTMS